MIENVVIVDAVRSAVGRAGKGSLAYTRPDELAGQVIAALLARVPQVKPSDVEDLALGCAMPEGEQGMNVARIAGLLGGLPVETSAMTINRFCSSGLQAIAIAAGAIATGANDVVIAGGVESMTMVPMTGNHLSASPTTSMFLNIGEVLGERVGVNDVRRFDAVQNHVHDRYDVGEGFLFLAIEGALLKYLGFLGRETRLRLHESRKEFSQRKPAEPQAPS